MDIENLSCVVLDEADEDLENFVVQRLEAFNERQSPWILRKRMPGRGPMPLQVYLRNPDGDTFGGAIGYTLWDWLDVENLWVWDELRGRGCGARLLHAIEEAAWKRGCRHVQLHTWDFQTPGFYQKCGYRIVGELEDYPPGHSSYWMRKDLAEQ